MSGLLSVQDNAAAGYGGAIYSIQPTISSGDRAVLPAAEFAIGSMVMTNSDLTSNHAQQGGCMYVTGNGANITTVNTNFQR